MITYAYDRMGRVVKEAYSDGTPAVGEKVSYGYDAASNQTSVTDGRGTTEYEFDASGTPTRVWYDSYGVEERVDIATDNRGRRTDVWMETNPEHTVWAAHQHTDYDKSGRVSRVVAKYGNGDGTNTTVQDKTYCYAAGTTAAGGCTTTASNDRGKIQWVKDAVDGSVTTYTYDGAGQLAKATRTGGKSPKVYTYTYDARGNRLTSTASGPYPATNFTFNPANQITTSGYTYDGAGNLTKDNGGTFTYNAAGQMVSHTRTAANPGTYNYTYAGGTQSELLKQATTNGNYEYGYGRTNQFGLPVVEQVTLDGETAHLDNDPVTGQPLMLQTSGGTHTLYIYDGVGNPEAIVTNLDTVATAYDYDPYGVPTLTKDSGGQATDINPYQFKGGIHDRTTNWVKFGHRWYSVGTGRFTQRDTLDAPLDPGNANRYTFAANDPINNSDPLGLYSILNDGRGDCLAGMAIPAVRGLAIAAAGGPVGLGGYVGGMAAGCAVGIAQGAIVDGVAQETGGDANKANAILTGSETVIGLAEIVSKVK